MTRTLFPNDGPAYSVVSEVRWDCPREKLPEVVTIIEGAFKAAPTDRIANELYKLRMLTAGRDQKDAADQEAENVIWLEQLRCYPGDIVIDVLRGWTKPSNPSGKWWPTWNDIAARLEQACDRRQALLNFIRQLAERPAPVKAITDQPPTPEQRAAAVARWEEQIRPQIKGQDATSSPLDMSDAAVKRRAEEALERHERNRNTPVTIGHELAKKLAGAA